MKHFFRKYRNEMIGMLAGAIAGFSYYYFVGCASGACPITSNPYASTMYGMVAGWLVGGLFKKESKHSSQYNENN